MSRYLIHLGDVEAVAVDDHHLHRRPLITRERHSDALSMTWVDLDGRHGALRSDVSDRVYYVISGQGRFEIGGEELTAATGDTVWIPRGTPYVFEGRMEYLVINGPAFVPGSDIPLE